MVESNTNLLLEGWLDGAVRSYAYMAGSEGIKNFLKSASEVCYAHLLEAAENKGLAVRANDPQSVIEQVGKIETGLGILPEGHVKVAKQEDNLEVEYIGCPYAHVCSGILSDMIEKAAKQTTLPCFRSEVYMSAIAVEARGKGKYTLKQYAPGERCAIEIELI
jgi:hypothetical protein